MSSPHRVGRAISESDASARYVGDDNEELALTQVQIKLGFARFAADLARQAWN